MQHFELRTDVIPGKGMIVCMSREICAHLYNAITALRPDWHHSNPEKGAIKVVMTGSVLISNSYNHISIINRQKNSWKNGSKMQTIRSNWLSFGICGSTGFDAPSCHTMYVDKPMRGHNLMQAIARVNRVFKDKPGGLVVDYIGIGNELKKALKIYTDSKGRGTPTLLAEEAFALLLEKLEVVRSMFHRFDYSDYETNAIMLLPMATNHILGVEDGKKRFLDAVMAITKAFSLCSTLDEAAPLRKEIAFFAAIKATIIKYTTVDKKRTEEEKNSVLETDP